MSLEDTNTPTTTLLEGITGRQTDKQERCQMPIVISWQEHRNMTDKQTVSG